MSASGQKQTSTVRTTVSAKCQKRTWRATAFRLASVSVKRVAWTCRHIKTGWCSPRRVAHLGMAAAWNGDAADDGASNLWLCSSGSLRVTFVLLRRRASGDQRECKHNGCNNGYDCFHCVSFLRGNGLAISASVNPARPIGSICIVFLISSCRRLRRHGGH